MDFADMSKRPLCGRSTISDPEHRRGKSCARDGCHIAAAYILLTRR
jgi:hypothetical protein